MMGLRLMSIHEVRRTSNFDDELSAPVVNELADIEVFSSMAPTEIWVTQ